MKKHEHLKHNQKIPPGTESNEQISSCGSSGRARAPEQAPTFRRITLSFSFWRATDSICHQIPTTCPRREISTRAAHLLRVWIASGAQPPAVSAQRGMNLQDSTRIFPPPSAVVCRLPRCFFPVACWLGRCFLAAACRF